MLIEVFYQRLSAKWCFEVNIDLYDSVMIFLSSIHQHKSSRLKNCEITRRRVLYLAKNHKVVLKKEQASLSFSRGTKRREQDIEGWLLIGKFCDALLR